VEEVAKMSKEYNHERGCYYVEWMAQL
jgi:hypothetical protein